MFVHLCLRDQVGGQSSSASLLGAFLFGILARHYCIVLLQIKKSVHYIH